MKITFIGAGSTIFAKNVLGDVMLTPAIRECEIALYDIYEPWLNETYETLCYLNEKYNESRAVINKYLGVESRKDALHHADFVINAIQVGGYKPGTVIDFEVPKKYGLRQTIADTLGIGGIFRALRTIPVMEDFARDMEQVCPDALLLNYTNPMAMLTGFMLHHTGVKTVGLCHSVQSCSPRLLKKLGIEYKEPLVDRIYGINHMAWLLEIRDGTGKDLYPEVRKRALAELAKEKSDCTDLVRFEYIRRLGYYCTESSEHNAEYNAFFLKKNYPELIERYNIPLDEYIRRCENQINIDRKRKTNGVADGTLTHSMSHEYGAKILNAIVTDTPLRVGGNVLNTGFLISNLPEKACVEVSCMVDGRGINPCREGELPTALAALNQQNIAVQLLTIEAAVSKKKEDIYRAAMFDPHTAAELSIDDIISLCDDLIEAHGDYLPKYH